MDFKKSDLESTALMHLRRESITAKRYRREFPTRLVDFYFAQLVQHIVRHYATDGGRVSKYLEQIHRNKYTLPSVDQIFEGKGDRGENDALQELLTAFATHVELHIFILTHETAKQAWAAMTLFGEHNYPVQVITTGEESHGMTMRAINKKYATLSNSHKENPTVYITKKDIINGATMKEKGMAPFTFWGCFFYSPGSPAEFESKIENPIRDEDAYMTLRTISEKLDPFYKKDYSPSYVSPQVEKKSPPPMGSSSESPVEPVKAWGIFSHEVEPLVDRKLGARCDPSLPHCYNEHELPEMRDLVKQILMLNIPEERYGVCAELLTSAETYIQRKLNSEDFAQLVEDGFKFVRNPLNNRKKTRRIIRNTCSTAMTAAVRAAITMYMEGDKRVFKPMLERILRQAKDDADIEKFKAVVQPDTKYILLRLLDYSKQKDASRDITEIIGHNIGREFSS
jgi:hypothetical protein